MAPPASCIVPIGEELIIAGLRRRYQGCEYFSSTRPPSVYRGNPFVVECGLAYGGNLPAEESADVMRFANRVPLQYQPKACAISEAVYELNWRNYGLSQPKGSLPVAPMAIFVHLASVWVPFTSEAKEAVAHYPELLREITLALQECGRKLAQSLRARARAESEHKRKSLFERYIPELGASLGKITGRDAAEIEGLFFKALPNFVKIAELAGPEKAGAGEEEGEATGAGAGGAEPGADDAAPPADAPAPEADTGSMRPPPKGDDWSAREAPERTRSLAPAKAGERAPTADATTGSEEPRKRRGTHRPAPVK